MNRLRKMNKMASTAVFLILSSLVFPFTGPVAKAQATTGTIRGVVSDQAGAVVAGATIYVKNQATGVESAKFKTTGDGIYNIPSLIPGTYTVTVEAPNFKRALVTDIELKVDQVATIDAALQPGGAAETVTVTAGGEEILNKENAQVSTSFDKRKVNELPSNIAGGGIDTLALLAPGVIPGIGNVNGNGTTLSVNGNRARANNFTIDGQDNNDPTIGGPSYFVDNQDAVSDFQVITNNFSAQYGRNQGAIVNIVTKSGTNEFHGSAFENHRDRNNFDSLTNIERRRGDLNPAPLLRNVFGVTIGGPVWIPKVFNGRDKAFFFFAYQGLREPDNAIVPSGNLAILGSELARLKAAFPGNNAIAAYAAFSPFAITDFGTLSQRTDAPTDTVTIGGQTFAAAFPQRQVPLGTISNEYAVRGDYKMGDRDSFTGRYLYQLTINVNNLASPDFTGDVPAKSQNLGAGWTRQVNSRSVNEFKFAYSRGFFKFGGGCEGKFRACIPDPVAIDKAFTNIAFSGVRGNLTQVALGTIGIATNLPQGRLIDTFQFQDNLSVTRGKHQMIMGADIRRLRNNVPFLPLINGAFNFGSAAALAANNPTTATVAAGQSTIGYKEFDQFYFFQDDFKVRDNLTINLGVRYEFIGQPFNLLNEISVARESNPDTALWRQSLPLDARIAPKIPSDKNNWAPRIGFAYSPRTKGGWLRTLFGEDSTVLRGGYSVAYEPPFYNIHLNLSTNAPLVFSTTVLGTTPPAAAPFPVPSDATGVGVRGFATSQSLLARNVLDPRLLAQVPVSPNFHSPYSQQWSFGIERQLNKNNVFEVRYLGNHGVGLFQTNNTNPRFDRLLNGFTAPVITGYTGAAGTTPVTTTLTFPGFPGLVPTGLTPVTCVNIASTPDNEGVCNGRLLAGRGRIQARENTAQSIYHSLQTRWNGRLFNQFTVGASYTLSKNIDNVSEILGNGAETAIAQDPFNINRAERGLSGFDRKHGFAANGLWDIPLFKGQKGVVGHILGGWQINATQILTTGRPFTVAQNSNLNGTFNAGRTYGDELIGDVFRPFYGNANAPKNTAAISQIDAALMGFRDPTFTSAFRVVAVVDPNGFWSLNDLNNGKLTAVTKDQVRYILNGPGSAKIFGSPFGNVPRSSERGPMINELNAGFFKNTRVREHVNIQFRTEIFNLFNHRNAGYGFNAGASLPQRSVNNAGTPGNAFNDFTDIAGARRVFQFGLRVSF